MQMTNLAMENRIASTFLIKGIIVGWKRITGKIVLMKALNWLFTSPIITMFFKFDCPL